jgi:uncharacterized membrane protein
MLTKVIWLIVLGIILATVLFYLLSLVVGAAYYFLPILAIIVVGVGLMHLFSQNQKPEKISQRKIKQQDKAVEKELKQLAQRLDGTKEAKKTK